MAASSSSIPSQRSILPISATCSLKTSPTPASAFDPDRAVTKLEMRITDYFLTALRETVLGTSFTRGKTVHQGARAPRGYQAAHHSLLPNPQDSLLEKTLRKVAESDLTPTKSLPYFKARTGLSTPDLKRLNENADNQKESFKERILKLMPDGSITSSIAGTTAYLVSNSTFDNPAECNRLDSKLERTIAPHLQVWQDERAEGKMNPIESTEQLILWMKDFYQGTVMSSVQRENDLTNCLNAVRSSEALTAATLRKVQKILEKRLDCLPSIKLPPRLKKNITLSQLILFIEEKLSSLTHYREEALLFLKHLDLYDSSCTIPNLQLALFGVIDENGIRRQPTPEELEAEIYRTLKPDSTFPIKRRRQCTKQLFKEAPLHPSS